MANVKDLWSKFPTTGEDSNKYLSSFVLEGSKLYSSDLDSNTSSADLFIRKGKWYDTSDEYVNMLNPDTHLPASAYVKIKSLSVSMNLQKSDNSDFTASEQNFVNNQSLSSENAKYSNTSVPVVPIIDAFNYFTKQPIFPTINLSFTLINYEEFYKTTKPDDMSEDEEWYNDVPSASIATRIKKDDGSSYYSGNLYYGRSLRQVSTGARELVYVNKLSDSTTGYLFRHTDNPFKFPLRVCDMDDRVLVNTEATETSISSSTFSVDIVNGQRYTNIYNNLLIYYFSIGLGEDNVIHDWTDYYPPYDSEHWTDHSGWGGINEQVVAVPYQLYIYPYFTKHPLFMCYAVGDYLDEDIRIAKYDKFTGESSTYPDPKQNHIDVARQFVNELYINVPKIDYNTDNSISGTAMSVKDTNADLRLTSNILTSGGCSLYLNIHQSLYTDDIKIYAFYVYRTETSYNSNTWSDWKFCKKVLINDYQTSNSNSSSYLGGRVTFTYKDFGFGINDDNKRVQVGVVFLPKDRIEGVTDSDVMRLYIGDGTNELIKTGMTNVYFWTHNKNMVFTKKKYTPPKPNIILPNDGITYLQATDSTITKNLIVDLDDRNEPDIGNSESMSEYNARLNQWHDDAEYKMFKNKYDVEFTYDYTGNGTYPSNANWQTLDLDKAYVVTDLTDLHVEDWRYIHEVTLPVQNEQLPSWTPTYKYLAVRTIAKKISSDSEETRPYEWTSVKVAYVNALLVDPIVLISRYQASSGSFTDFVNIDTIEPTTDKIKTLSNKAKTKIQDNSFFRRKNLYVSFKGEDEDTYSDYTIKADETVYSKKGNYRVKAVAYMKTSNFSNEVIKEFVINDGQPPQAVIYGVSTNQVKANEEFEISVKKQSGNTIECYISKNGGSYTKVSTTIGTYKDIDVYQFKESDEATYNLKVVTTNDSSKISRNDYVYNFRIIKSILSSGLIEFIKADYPQHSTQVVLHSGNPKLNTTQFKIDEIFGSGIYKNYSSPYLIFENYEVDGRDGLPEYGVDYYTETKVYTGITSYIPELPEIHGVEDEQIYNTPRNISFTNTATKPDEARYLILLDGELVDNPFNTSTPAISQFYKDGWHFITMIGLNKIRPEKYNMSSMSFLIRVQDEVNLRKPLLTVNRSVNTNTIENKVIFSNVNEDFVHSIRIDYDDGTYEEYEYPYNVGAVTLTISKNCTVTATTTLNEMKVSSSAVEKITDIFTWNPPTNDIKFYGIMDYDILNEKGNKETVSIGNYCIANVSTDINVEYEAYLNGTKYELGTIITNPEAELKKYCLEIIMINKWRPELKSKVHKEFFIDTIKPAYPLLMNHDPYLMNRMSLNHKIQMKKEGVHETEESILNDRIIDVNMYLIRKDEEYILTVSYTYYNGTVRSNSFYFSVNSNPKRDLEKNRLILKANNYKEATHEDEEERLEADGEFIVDRMTGHLWYNKEGVITPITKNVEDLLLSVEERLSKIENEHILFNHLYRYLDEYLSYLKEKASSFYKELQEKKQLLLTIAQEIDSIISDTSVLNKDISDFTTQTDKNVAEVTNNYEKELKDLLDKFKKLNEDFINWNMTNVVVTLDDASLVNQTEYITLPNKIASKISLADYNDFVNNEKSKYYTWRNEYNTTLGSLKKRDSSGNIVDVTVNCDKDINWSDWLRNANNTYSEANYNKTQNID